MIQQNYNYKILKSDHGVDTVVIFCGLDEMNDTKKRQEMIQKTGLSKDNHEFTFLGTGVVNV